MRKLLCLCIGMSLHAGMHGLSQEESYELAVLLQTLSYCMDYRLEVKSSTYNSD